MFKAKAMDDDLCAVFVHAGAGYHSRENEKRHLLVCEMAAEAGMEFLRRGGNAVDAVETAIMMLENAPITNAGFGSNVNEKGVVECDASIVDHFGRSGAVGAVANVRNPIQLARVIYDKAHSSPGLSRVPPNFLCGEGAQEFAWDNGIILVPNEEMVAPIANIRYHNWKNDINQWNIKNPPTEEEKRFKWCRGAFPPERYPGLHDRLEAARLITPIQMPSASVDDVEEAFDGLIPKEEIKAKWASSTNSDLQDEASIPTLDSIDFSGIKTSKPNNPVDGEDWITDTVGAIAVDRYGNIAAGSSSGGIGMKHRGRIGPAALIGIGTHVAPVDPTDANRTSVAVVASGTGEHITSSFAASTCAQRLYYSQRMGNGGVFDDVTEEEAIAAMLQHEFNSHPAIINSNIDGSLGLMAVKKTVQGIGLYFAHNTESFAIASFTSRDKKPQCVMSRNPNKAPVAMGGLMIRPTQ
ncbi:hypothetical protein N7488_011394 [Penicillium malachiteum]|nr:hypothetical protein N7488_011394 [Penicillium malachiteum]